MGKRNAWGGLLHAARNGVDRLFSQRDTLVVEEPEEAVELEREEDAIPEEAFLSDAPPPEEVAESGAVLAWDRIPAVLRYHERLMTGGQPDRYGSFVNYALVRWGGSLRDEPLRALVLGHDAHSSIPQELLESGRVANVTVADFQFDPTTRFDDARVRWEALDLNRKALPDGEFDLIIASGVLQKVRALEWLFDQMLESLASGGLLVMRDYVGPNRLQYTDRQMDLANATLRLLPEPFRTEQGGVLRERQERPDRQWMARVAPQRAVRSEDIIGYVHRRMKVLEFQPLGGSILAPLLEGITECFAGDQPEAIQALDALIEAESVLIEGGLLASDYCFVIARKPY